MFGRFVSGFKQALQVQSEPPTPSPGSPIPSRTRPNYPDQQAPPDAQRFASSDSLAYSKPDLLLEGLSEEEKAHILNVMARADSTSDISSKNESTAEMNSNDKPMRSSTGQARRDSLKKLHNAKPVQEYPNEMQPITLPVSTSASISDIPLEGLTEEERKHILRVMARAESGSDINKAGYPAQQTTELAPMRIEPLPTNTEPITKSNQFPSDTQPISRIDQNIKIDSTSKDQIISKFDSIPKLEPTSKPEVQNVAEEDLMAPMIVDLQNSGLEEWELLQIMSVMNKARRESDTRESLPPPDDDMMLMKNTPSHIEQQSIEKQKFDESQRLIQDDEREDHIEPNDISDNEEGVHSSEETEGADEESPIDDDDTDDSSPSPIQEQTQYETNHRDVDIIHTPKQPATVYNWRQDQSLLGMLPEGMESLSVEEQEQIVAVLRRAIMDVGGHTVTTPAIAPDAANGHTVTAPFTAPSAVNEWREEEETLNNNEANNEQNEQPEMILDDSKVYYEEEEKVDLENKYEEEMTESNRRRIPDLKFEMTEDQEWDSDEENRKKDDLLCGSSPVSITIQPPSPCPTDTSSSGDEEEYWTQVQQMDRDDELDQQPDQRDQADQGDRDEEYEDDQPQEIADTTDMLTEPREEYDNAQEEENEQKEYDEQKYLLDWNEDEEVIGSSDGMQWVMDEKDTQQPWKYGAEQETQMAPSPVGMPLIEEAEESPEYEEPKISSIRLLNEDITGSPISDRQRSPTEEYVAGDDVGGEADNEEQICDRFDTEEANVETSSFDDGGMTAPSIYTSADYYAAVEYQRSESGSSSGYGSRGVLGMSSYASGEALSQQGITLTSESGQAFMAQNVYDSGLSGASSLQESFSKGSENAYETMETRKIMEDSDFTDFMTRITPTEPVISAYNMAYGQNQTMGKNEPSMDYYENQYIYSQGPIQETIETSPYELYFPQSYDVSSKREYVSTIPYSEPVQHMETKKYDKSDKIENYQMISDQKFQTQAPYHQQSSSQIYSQEPAQRPMEKQKEAVPAAANQRTPERTSLFGSLKQAATSPSPKSAFGSLFSGASQALKSQTEAVLKKAVDTVNQVAAANDAISKTPSSMPASPAPASPSYRKSSTPTIEESISPQSNTAIMETSTNDYDDDQYSLKRMIRHEPIIPVKQEVITQYVQQPTYVQDWPIEPKPVHVPESQPPPAPSSLSEPMPQSTVAATMIEVPGMPDLDLSQFNEEERAHLLAMIGKAKEMEAELKSTPSVTPSRSTSFTHHTPISTVIEEEEVDEDTIRLLESYKAASGSSIPIPSSLAKSADSNNLPWPVPSIREISATPECHIDVEEAFAAANVERAPSAVSQQQQYDSSEVSSTVDEVDQQQRMTDIEADFTNDIGHKGRQIHETSSLIECPLCNRMVLRCSQGSYGSTGQMCADCGVVICTDCGSVVPRYMGKVWLCNRCQLEEQVQMQTQVEQQMISADHRGNQQRHHKSIADSETSIRRQRHRTTTIGHPQQGSSDEDDYDRHDRPSAALSQDEPKTFVRTMAKPSSRDANDSDESDEEISALRTTDDDDYPDEVIEVPPAPVETEVAGEMPNANMDMGNANGFGADVLAAIASTFSSTSSDFYTFGDRPVDSSPEKRFHLQQQQQIAFTSAASLTQTTPPPVPARTHRAAPPPPTTGIESEQRSEGTYFTPDITPASLYDSVDVTEPIQFSRQETKVDGRRAVESVDSSSSLTTGMRQEIVQHKRNLIEGDASLGERDSSTSLLGHVVDRSQPDCAVAPAVTEGKRMDEVHSTMLAYSDVENEQAAVGESEEEEEEEEEQIDYAQAMKYYNNNPFFTHRPGPVYTIPEDEESDDLSGETDDISVSSGYKESSRTSASPNYQQLLKQHQEQQQLRQQQQQQFFEQQSKLQQVAVLKESTQPPAMSTASIQKRNPFIDEIEEYENYAVEQRQPSKPPEPVQHRVSQVQTKPGFVEAHTTGSSAVGTHMPLTREVTSLVSSQHYFASQQQQQQKLDRTSSSGMVRAQPPLGPSIQSSYSAAADTVADYSIDATGVESTSISTQFISREGVTTRTYAPMAAAIVAKGEEQFQRMTRAQTQPRTDVTTYAGDEQATSAAQFYKPDNLLQEKRLPSGAVPTSIDQTAPSLAAKSEPSGTAIFTRPILAFHDMDSTAGHYHAQQAPQEVPKARDKVAMSAEQTPTSSSDEFFYQPGTAAVGQLIWKRDDQQDSQPVTSMSASQTSSAGSRSSEDEEGQDLDSQFVSKLKRSPAMILHADVAAAAAAAAAGRRPPTSAMVQQPVQPQMHQQQQRQPGEYYEDILTEDAPVAWPTFMSQKAPAPHQLPPFPPPPTSSRQRYPSGTLEGQASAAASSGLASAPSSTISTNGGGAVAAAGGRPPEMGRRKLPSIPQTVNAVGTSQCEPYGHYGSTSFGMESQQLYQLQPQQQQQPYVQSSQEGTSTSGQSWRGGIASVTAPNAKDQRLRLVHATPSLRMPATLARVLLKQELREALTKRQQQLEACEIEANQRQYMVQRFLHTGIYPPSIGLQPTIPRTILCTLPADLLAGCRILYNRPSTQRVVSTSGSYALPNDHSIAYINRPETNLSSMNTRGVTSINGTTIVRSTVANASITSKPIVPSSWSTSYKDVSIMTEPEMPKTVTVGGRFPRPNVTTSKANVSTTTRFNDAETQTWATTTSAVFLSSDTGSRNKENFAGSSTFGASRNVRTTGSSTGITAFLGASKTVSTSTEDLDKEQGLMKKHRKLRMTTSAATATPSSIGNLRDHHQSKRLAAYFSDEEDDSTTREIRKSKIKDEIARRKQTLDSSIGIRNYPSLSNDYGSSAISGLGLPPLYASDYSSHVPHYGSLPRMDFPSRHQYTSSLSDANRGIAPVGLDTYHMQQPGFHLPPPRRAISLSGGGGGDYTSGWKTYSGSDYHRPTRGPTDADYFSDFGDYMSLSTRDPTSSYYNGSRPLQSSNAGAIRQISNSAPYLSSFSDAPSYRTLPGGGSTGMGAESGLLSHYASYLNREFANSSTNMKSNVPDPYSHTWGTHDLKAPQYQYSGQSGIPGTSFFTEGNYVTPLSAQTPSMWPQSSSLLNDRTVHSSFPSTTQWNSAMSSAPYRSDIQQQIFPTTGSSMPTPSYGQSTYPDRSWLRNSYRPAYQHPYFPPSAASSLPTARSLDILRSGLGLTSNAGGGYSGTFGTSRAYQDNGLGRTPYWSPLEISTPAGTYGGETGLGSFHSGAMIGPGLGNTIRYDSGYSSGGAGAGYASDSYHSNIGGLTERQSTMGRSSGYSNRPAWSSSDFRNSLGGYVSDSTIERRRFKVDGIDDSTMRYRAHDLAQRIPDGPHIKRVLLTKMGKDRVSNGSGLGMKIVGGKMIPGTIGELGAFVTSIHKGGLVDTLGEVKEGDQILEWNGIPLTGKTYEEVQRIIENSYGEIEIVLRSNHNQSKYQSATFNRPDNSECNYALINGHSRSVGGGTANGNQSAFFTKQGDYYNDTILDGKASPCFSTTPRSRSPLTQGALFVTGLLRLRLRFDPSSGTLFVHVLSARDLRPRSVTASSIRSGYPNPFVKIYLLPGRIPENKRRTKFVSNTCNPEWDQTVVYKDLSLDDLHTKYLEFTVWDYDRFVENQFLGRVLLSLSDASLLSGVARYFPLQSLA